jgi:hypothetical protein
MVGSGWYGRVPGLVLCFNVLAPLYHSETPNGVCPWLASAARCESPLSMNADEFALDI